MTQLTMWLEHQLRDRGWSQSEAARRGGFSPSMIQQVLSGATNPGLDFFRGVSRAFGLPMEDVLRLAGILPARPARINDRRRSVYEANGDERLLALWRALSPDDQLRVYDLMERLAGLPAPEAPEVPEN